MTTTEHLRVKPDFYLSQEECIVNQKNRISSNKKYPNFYQSIFTAGDEDQFQEYRDETNGNICENEIFLENNLYKDLSFSSLDWFGYDNIPASSVLHTFRYIFNKFKKGIFVKIKDNKLDVFLPFSNNNFVNEWSNRIKIDPKFTNLNDFIKHIYNLEKKPQFFNPNKVNQYISTWFANNCLVRYDYPITEGDHSISQLSDMFKELCKLRKVPDIEFFINRRDNLILKKDYTEPYYHIYDSFDLPLLSHKYDKYSPIFSFTSREGFADIPIPTANDWSRISFFEGKYFYKEQCHEYPEKFNTSWKDKIPTAMFRGATTGCGVTIETNPRLKIAYLSTITPPDEDNIPLLNAGITKWNIRPRKLYKQPYLTTIDYTKLPFGLSNFLSYEEQSKYKYIVNIDGYVTAFRFSIEMNMGSVILLVESPYKIWFYSLLKEWEHYVPVKQDLSDLIDKIKWCKSHDKECEIIASNAKKFYQTYLLKNGILDYLQNLLINTKKKIGSYLYNFLPYKTALMYKELPIIKDSYPKQYFNSDKYTNIYSIPNHPRSYSLLQGIQWAINLMLNDKRILPFKTNLVKENVNKKIYEGIFTNIPLLTIIKDLNKDNIYNNIHNIFIGLKGVNLILKEIPNFQYTFDYYISEGNIYTILESMDNYKSFSEYITSPKFSLKDYLYILLQISIVLQVSQNTCSFIHGNLTPDNILIQFFPEERFFDYNLNVGKVIRIKTKFIPIIINYHKSSIIYDKVYYGYNPSLGNLYDILTLIYSSIQHIFSTKNISKVDFPKLLTLSNIFPSIMNLPKFVNSFSIKEFIKNYDIHLKGLFTDNSQLQKIPNDNNNSPEAFIHDHSPLQTSSLISVFEYINNISSQPITIKSHFEYTMNTGNSDQVFKYIFSKTKEEQLNSYLEVYDNIKKCNIPQPKDKLYAYYITQTLYDSVKSNFTLLKYFAQANNIPFNKFDSLHKNIVNYITSIFSLKLNGINYHIEIPNISIKNTLNEYNIEIYENPQEILKMDICDKEMVLDISKDKEIYIKLFNTNNKYSLNKVDYDFYVKDLKEIIDKSSDLLRKIDTKTKTIYLFSKEIYSYNVNKLINDDKKCLEENVQKYLNYYIKILEKIK